MRTKLAAVALAFSVLVAPLAVAPAFAATDQAYVVKECKVSADACKAAVALFIKDNPGPGLKDLVIALVRELSTDASIPKNNVSAGLTVVVASTHGDGALVGVFSTTQLQALADIQAAVNNGGPVVKTAAPFKDFSTS